MNNFAKWLREVLKSNAHEAKHGEDRAILWDLRLMVVDRADLAAQQHEALELYRGMHERNPATSVLSTTTDALAAAEAFKEKYELVEGAAASINQAVKNGAHK